MVRRGDNDGSSSFSDFIAKLALPQENRLFMDLIDAM
jgi:hypothetical protein